MSLDHNTLVLISYAAVMLVLGAIGEMLQKLIAAKAGDYGWRGVYYVTKSYHPIFVSALLFAVVVDVPLFEHVESTVTNRMISGAGVGAITMVAYELTVKTIRKAIITFGDRLGGYFADWAHKLGGSSNTPTKRTAIETHDEDAET